MKTTNINAVASSLQDLLAKTHNNKTNNKDSLALAKPDLAKNFASLLEKNLDQVNKQRLSAESVQNNMLKGSEAVDLSSLLVATQSASVTTEATVAFRDKLLGAYTEIMNMPV